MSLKKELTINMADLLTAEAMEKNKIAIITSIGLITGRYPTEKELEDKDNSNSALTKFCTNIGNEYKKTLSLSETDKLPGDEGYLYLVDVVIKAPNQSYRLPFMIVFFDQIIGISMGSM